MEAPKKNTNQSRWDRNFWKRSVILCEATAGQSTQIWLMQVRRRLFLFVISAFFRTAAACLPPFEIDLRFAFAITRIGPP